MSEETGVERGPIHAVIASTADAGEVVTGWVLVVETMAPSGMRFLTRVSSDASGERGMTRWGEQGLLHNCLHGDGGDGWRDE